MAWLKPETDQIRTALRRYAPQLEDEPIEFLAEGWECWIYQAGDFALRFPKSDTELSWLYGNKPRDAFEVERVLLPELAVGLPVQIPVIEIFGEDGPNGMPFTGHRLIPGEVVITASRPPTPNFGRDLGRLIAALHAFSPQRALELGVPLLNGPRLRQARAGHYEDVIRRVFPLVSCEARTRIEQVYEDSLNQPANFEFEPCLVHQDLDCNTLIDSATGEMSGLIDFGDVVVGNAAMDFWLPVYGFKKLGIESQLTACLEEAGVDDKALQRMQPELSFINFRYPILDILHGLDIDDQGFVTEGIESLNRSLPADLACD
jgi:aminoglycoside phosphotransferase (APT) family kinase protein